MSTLRYKQYHLDVILQHWKKQMNQVLHHFVETSLSDRRFVAVSTVICMVTAYFIINKLSCKGKRKNKALGPVAVGIDGVQTNTVKRLSLSLDDIGGSVENPAGTILDTVLPRETKSDFVRTISANNDNVYFSMPKEYLHPSDHEKLFQDHKQILSIRFPYMSLTKSSAADIVLQAFEQKLSSFLNEIKDITITKEDQLSMIAMVARFVTISPCMQVACDTGMLPALYQPAFSIILCKSADDQLNLRVAVDAFIGGPPKGPPNPSLKYTDYRVRILSHNIADLSSELYVDYVLQLTKCKHIKGVIDNSEKDLEKVLEGSSWEGYLKC